jgi:ribosomal subunit interface protein
MHETVTRLPSMTGSAPNGDVLDIHFNDIDRSDAIEAAIREKAAKLVEHDARIASCRVVVSRPKARGRRGHLYKVRIELEIPGGTDVIVDRDAGIDHSHEDVYIAIRDAFAAAERRLEERVSRHKGAIKHHDAPPHGRVSQVFHPKGYGFIRASTGEDVYFHRNALAQGDFDALEVGSEVRYAVAETESEHGPQATTVIQIAKHHIS